MRNFFQKILREKPSTERTVEPCEEFDPDGISRPFGKRDRWEHWHRHIEKEPIPPEIPAMDTSHEEE